MLEPLARFLGRHVRIRGIARVLRYLYPEGTASTRFVRGVRARADGLLVEVDTRQLIDWHLVFQGEYEPHVGALFARLVPAGAVVADIGANVGAHTLTLARLAGARGRVLAFEPNPPTLDRLARNVALNNLTHVTTYGCALGAGSSKMSLRVPAATSDEAANSGMASLVALNTPHDLVDVEVRALDDVVAEAGIERLDLIKIDVQGFELAVLQGMARLCARCAPAIVFEYEDWAWAMTGSDFRAVRELLAERGYALFTIDGAARLTPIEGEGVPEGHADVLAVPSDDPRLPRLVG